MIFVSHQFISDVSVIVHFDKPDGTPDTGATISCIAFGPTGIAVTFTDPTVLEIEAGVYRLTFPANAPAKLFTSVSNGVTDAGAYTLIATSSTAGTLRQAIRAHVIADTKSPFIPVDTVINTYDDLSMKTNYLYLSLINTKKLIKIGDEWRLVVYEDDGETPLYSKAIKDKSGDNISDLPVGVIAQECVIVSPPAGV